MGYWKLDEGYGTTANNSGSLGSTGNLTLHNMSSPANNGSGWTNAGKFGKALSFDGNNDYVSGSLPDNTVTNTVTMSGWINPLSTANQNNFIGLGVTAGDRIHVVYNETAQKFGCDNTSGGTYIADTVTSP